VSYCVVPGDIIEHKSTLLSLWDRNFQGVVDGRYAWIYENNVNGVPTVFLLKHNSSGSFVGALSLFPRDFFRKGIKIKGYICGDMVVDKEHRTLGPAVSLMKAAIRKCREEDPCILLTFPNDKSEVVALRVGFKKLGDYLEMTKVIRTQRYLERHISSKIVAKVFSMPFDLALRLRHEIMKPYSTKNYSYKIISKFDQKFDNLWKSMMENFSALGARDSKYLQWRIKDSPYHCHKIFTMFSDNETKLLGYIAYFVMKNRVQIVDFAYAGEKSNFHYLFCGFTEHQRQQGIDSFVVGVFGDTSLIKAFRERGFSLRGVKYKVITCASTNDLDLLTEADGNWYMTAADNDV
jgi:GNAT superfamily N-acetyltransferase